MGRHSFSFLPSLLSGVELVEAVTDDRDGQADNENPKDGTEASENLAKAGNRRHIPISNLEYKFVRNLNKLSCTVFPHENIIPNCGQICGIRGEIC